MTLCQVPLGLKYSLSKHNLELTYLLDSLLQFIVVKYIIVFKSKHT